MFLLVFRVEALSVKRITNRFDDNQRDNVSMNNYPEVRKLNPSLYETIDFFEMDYAEGSFSYNNLQSLSGITASYAPKALKKR